MLREVVQVRIRCQLVLADVPTVSSGVSWGQIVPFLACRHAMPSRLNHLDMAAIVGVHSHAS